MTARKVYIILLNYVQWEDTCECIESLLQSSYHNYSVIVVDNDSRNNSIKNIVERLASAPTPINDYREYSLPMLGDRVDGGSLPRLTFIQNETNAGFAAGNNIALRLLADSDAYIWLLNPDMVVRDDTLARLVDFAEEQAEECIIGAEIRPLPDDADYPFYGGGRINFLVGSVRPVTRIQATGELDYISGGCLFTRASNFKKYGLLPEEYFLYWEETDWCYRAKQKGVQLRVCIPAICYHKVSATVGRGFLSDYYYCRNSLIFVSKFRRRIVPIALFAMTLRLLRRIVSGKPSKARGAWRGTLDFIKGETGKTEFR